MALIMHRTRNVGVTGVKGQHTKGPWYSVGKVTRGAETKEAEQKSSKSWNPFKKC